MTEPSQACTIRFGNFELDVHSGELRKGRTRIRLQDQPLRVLIVLVNKPGELVSREELRQALWPSDTFVDFEHGLRVAVNKLRQALNDDPDHPRYVETLQRRGYRFIFPVTTPTLPTTGENGDYIPAHVELLSKAFRLTSVTALAGTVLLLGASMFVWWFYSRPRHPLTAKDTIVLADFTNTTGDAVFDDALKQALAMELGQSPFLNVLSDQKVGETLAMMNRPVNQHINANIGQEICLRTGSKVLVVGAISRIGTQYLINIKALSCGAGDSLAQEQIEAANKEDVLRAISRASSTLRTHLGESLPSVQKFDIPAEATTASLEALKSYSMGNTVEREKGEAPSIPFLKRAIELDSDFALAYAGLAERYTHLYQSSLALESAAKAYQLREKLTEREKLRVSASYFMSRKELEKEAQTYELWTANYPRDFVPHASLCADYMSMGQYDKALVEGQEALRLAPDDVVNYSNLGFTYLLLNRLDEAKATLDDALGHGLDGRELRWDIYQVAFLRGDSTQMEQQVAWATGKPGVEDTFLFAQSNSEVYYGHVKKAREFSQRAVDSSLRADSKERAALWWANAAQWEAELGNSASARSDAVAALALSSGRNPKMLAALALARTGNISKAQVLATDLQKDNPTYTMLNVLWLPTIKAASALAQGNSHQALVDLETAAPYEFSNNLNLLPAYIRGQAYLLEHNGAAAITEFQKLLDHTGIVHNSAQGALVRLQMGRAYSMDRDIRKARAAYNDFISFWKDADPDIPILRQAKAEYASLQ